MDDIICFVDKWKDFTEFIYYLVVIVGVFIAYSQLRANTKAQQALRSPLLYIYCPKDTDSINGLVIRNEGNVLATNITIYVSEKINIFSRIKFCFKNKKVPSSKKELPLLESGVSPSIYANKRELTLNDFNNIKVKVTYHSPFHQRRMKIKNKFHRE